MLDLRRLRLLCDLSRLRTIAAVAQANAYTPSAVSQQLSALEREAGVALLQRTGRSVRLTAAGRVLVEQGEGVLAAMERTTAALAAVSTGLSGPLRIGAFPSAVRTLIPRTLVALGHRHPALELMVTELDPVAVPAALRERRLDVGLLHDYDIVPATPDPGLDSVALMEETVFLAVPMFAPMFAPMSDSMSDPMSEPMSEPIGRLADARDSPWIMASPGTLCHTVISHVCRAAGFKPRARHHADDFETVLALVAAGQGVSLVPESAAAAHRAASPAAAVPPREVRLIELPIRRRTRIAYRKGAAGHPAISAFVSAIREAIEEK